MDQLLNMSNEALFTLLLAALVSLITSVLTATHWSPLMKQTACAVFSIVAAGVYVLIQEDTWHEYVRIALLVFVGATIVYKLLEPGLKQLSKATDVT